MVVATIGFAALAINSMPDSVPDGATVADGAVAGSPEALNDASTERSPQPTTAPPADAGEAGSTGLPTSTAGGATSASGPDGVTATPDGTESTSSTARTETETSRTGPIGADPMTTPGLRTSETVTSAWEDGYCLQIEVANETDESTTWQVVVDLDGTIAEIWNATVVDDAGDTHVFFGQEGYNATIRPGASTSFGTCIDTAAR